MRRGKLLIALLVGTGATLLQLVAVGALNDSSVAAVEETLSQDVFQPIVVTQPPPTSRSAPPRTQDTMRASTPKPAASAAQLRESALPALKGSSAKLGLLTVLPGLGDVGLGNVEVPDAPSEPDRPARARRTAQPVYPVSAQRDGIEGYVIVRLSIDSNGRVSNVLVVDSEPIGVFERSAREAARQFEFVPARVDGLAASATIEKKIVFSLQ
jgi:periplasmic protein TonB